MHEPRAIVFEEIPPDQRSGAEVLIQAGNGYFDGLEQADWLEAKANSDFARFACGPARNGGERPVRDNDAMAWRRPARCRNARTP